MNKPHSVGTVLHAFGLYPFTVEAVEKSRQIPGTVWYRTTLGRSAALVHETHAVVYRIRHDDAEKVMEVLRTRPGVSMPDTYEEALAFFELEDS